MAIRPSFILLVSFMVVSCAFAQYPAASQNGNRPNTVQNQLEFNTALAERLYNLIAKFINTNVNIILWLKKSFISFFVRGISYVSYFIANNPQYVSQQITYVSEMLRTFVLNVPYFEVPNVGKSATVNGVYGVPNSEPSWLYSVPNLLSSIVGVNGGGGDDDDDK